MPSDLLQCMRFLKKPHRRVRQRGGAVRWCEWWCVLMPSDLLQCMRFLKKPHRQARQRGEEEGSDVHANWDLEGYSSSPSEG
jgi:glutathione S-transferase